MAIAGVVLGWVGTGVGLIVVIALDLRGIRFWFIRVQPCIRPRRG